MKRRNKRYFGGFPANNISKFDPENAIITPYTYGLAVPRTSAGNACLCEDKSTYSRKCCKQYLINQGIGSITGVYSPYTRAFSSAFSDGFS